VFARPRNAARPGVLVGSPRPCMWVMQKEGSSRIVATTLARHDDEPIAPPQGGGFELRKVAGAIHGYG
jgi:hypothetical protein